MLQLNYSYNTDFIYFYTLFFIDLLLEIVDIMPGCKDISWYVVLGHFREESNIFTEATR